jgi:hypothetical protein
MCCDTYGVCVCAGPVCMCCDTMVCVCVQGWCVCAVILWCVCVCRASVYVL